MRFDSAHGVVAILAIIAAMLSGCDTVQPEIDVVDTGGPTPSYRPRPPETLPRLNVDAGPKLSTFRRSKTEHP